MPIALFITLVLILLSLVSSGVLAAQPEAVTFPSGELNLTGFIYRPKGVGPFPALLYNHGSERKPGWNPKLGELFSNKGYVFFLPTPPRPWTLSGRFPH